MRLPLQEQRIFLLVFFDKHSIYEIAARHNNDIIYTPEAVVFNTDERVPALMDEEDWYEVNVITCVVPNLRVHPRNSYNTGDGSSEEEKGKDRVVLDIV